MEVNPEEIQAIVRRVLEKIQEQRTSTGGGGGGEAGGGPPAARLASEPEPFRESKTYRAPTSEWWAGREGIFPTIDQCVREAEKAQEALVALGLEKRRAIIARMRQRFLEHVEEFSAHAVAETGLGRVSDKITKNRLAARKTPGVEDIEPRVFTGDDGITLLERAPWGVVGSITPTTNSTETICNNGIGIVAAGNAAVMNPHPRAKRTSQAAVSLLNRAIMEAGGPPNVLTAPIEPTLKTSEELMQHPGIKLLIVTGGGEVVRAAFRSGKRCICAGPGNPPVVVDETADIPAAARHIVAGCSLDNTVLCTAEKEIIVVESVAEALIEQLKVAGGYQVVGPAAARLEKLLLPEPGKLNRDLIGLDVQVILAKIGISVPAHFRLAFVEVHADHPLIFTETLLPVIPLARVRDVHAAIDLAIKAEKGHGHTAVMHSRNLDNLDKMARTIGTAIFVKNGPSFAGLGEGGEGFTSFSIAHPTGEGLTTARHFTREKRCVLKGYFRIV